jgi:hypothetical protein
MRVNPILVPIVVIAALLGSVAIATAAGVWSTSGRTSVSMEQLKPEDLKGWMTLQQVIDGVPIAKDELYALAGIPADVPVTAALKDLEELVPGFETSLLREALAASMTTPSPNPSSTSTTATATATATATTATATTATATPAVEHAGDGTGGGPTPLPPGQVLPADQIKGRMTLREVSEQCAVPLEKILEAMKLPAGTDPDAAVKDLVEQGVFAELETLRLAVADLQAAAP